MLLIQEMRQVFGEGHAWTRKLIHTLRVLLQALGRTEDAAALAARAAKYALLFDNRTGFFRPKLANGSVARVDYWGVSAASTGGPHAPADRCGAPGGDSAAPAGMRDRSMYSCG